MKIGVISDTHDNLEAIREIFARYADEGIDTVIHLGDLISPFVARIVGELFRGKLYLVLGNNDGDRLFLREVLEKAGFELIRSPAELEIAGRKLAVMHEPVFVDALARSGFYDAVLYGHTHRTDLRLEAGTLVLNPGEACGYLTGKATYAFLDLEALKAEVREV